MSAARANAPDTRAETRLRAFHEEVLLGKAYDARLVRRLWPYVRPQAKLLFVGFALLPLTAALQLLQPYLMKVAIDRGFLRHDLRVVTWTALGFFAALIVSLLGRVAQLYLLQYAGQRATNALRSDVFRHVHTLPLRFFDRTPVGRIVTRVTNDIDSLNEIFASGAVTAIGDVVTLAGIVVFLVFLNWRLALIALAALPPLVVVAEWFRRFARQAFRDIRVKIARLNAYLGEEVQGLAVVQAFGQEAQSERDFDEINAGYREANFRSIRYDALLYAVVEMVGSVCIAAILWYGGLHVLGGARPGGAGGAITFGLLVAFIEYMKMFFVPIQDLSAKYTVMQSAMSSAERIFQLLDVAERDAPVVEAAPPAAPATADTHAPALAFDDVSFAYKAGDPVLSGVTTAIRVGEKVAIVGPTGAGKTTLVSLALRLYEPDHGIIRMHGADVRTMAREALRSRFAVVPQDVFLFRGSVVENVAIGVGTPDRGRVRWAIEQVGAEGLLKRVGGLDAEMAERGQNFSLGERQLFAFARALYRDPEILILDEATANVDSETEAALQRAVERVLTGRTALVIAHRLSTIRHADRILVLQGGRLVEDGSHDELLRAGGLYARLYRLQFARGGPAAAESIPPAG